MTPVLQLLFLLFCLVTADSSGQETEDRTLTLHDDIPDKHRDDDKAEKRIRCAICKKIMKGVMRTVSKKIHKKLRSTCNTLIPSLRMNCYKYTIQLREHLIHIIFPGKCPYTMCKLLDMCW